MEGLINTMIETIKQFNAGYMKVELGEYSVFVADKETSEFIENALEEDLEVEE